MAAPDHDSPTSDHPAADAPAGSPPKSPSTTRLAGLALAVGLLAGAGAWIAGEAILESYRADLNPRIGREVDVEAVRRFAGAHLASASATFAALGGILGLGLGLAGGLARRSASAGARAALLGCVLGSIAGVSASRLVLPHFFKTHDPQSQDLLPPLLTIASIGSAIGAAGGLAFGVGIGGRNRWLKSTVGGLIGAALAAVFYEFGGAIAFPTAKTELPISLAYASRAMLHVLVATMAAAGSVLALGLAPEKRDGASPAS
jgi:hypothetical protein